MVKERRSRVSWDVNDIERLAQEVARLRVEYPDEALTTLVMRGQKTVFPPERQRKLATYNQAGPDFLKHLKLFLKQARPELVQPKVVKEVQYVEADEHEVVVNAATTTIVTELVSRMIAAFQGLGAMQTMQQATKLVATLEPAKTIQPKIFLGIAGMDSPHFRALENRLYPEVRLRYMHAQRPNAPAELDHILVLGEARRYWKDFGSPKVTLLEIDSLQHVTSAVKVLLDKKSDSVPSSSMG